MQKRVVYNFNAQTAAQTAAIHASGKAVKASNAIGKIKRAFSGKSLKLAVFVVLLFASLFCTIGSADWIISQQKNVPNGKDDKTFTIDEIGFDNYIDIPDIKFNGKPASANLTTTAHNGARELPKEAVDVNSGNVKYKVKPYKTSAQSRLLRAPQKAESTEKNNAPAANAATPLPKESDFDGIDYTTELPTDAGTYAVLITSTVKDASSGKTISYGKAIKVFTIAPCPVNIEWSGAVGFTYDGADHAGNITATAKTADGTINGIVKISYSYAAEPGATASAVTEVKNAGTYTATAEITNPNYTFSSSEAANETITFTVSQKELTVKADDKTVIYGESAPVYTATYTGLLDCDNGTLGTPHFECPYTTTSPVGKYPITVKGLANSNYNISYETGTLTVTQRTVTIAWGTENSFVYDGTAHTREYTANNVVNDDNLGLTVTVTGENISGLSAINAGTYTATASITNENYVIDENSKSATFTITARALTITANDHEITYGSAPATNGYTISGIIEGETPETANISGTVKLTTNYTQYGDVGKYDIIVDISVLSSPNYSFKAVNGILTVNKKELTVTAKPHQITYGDEPSANGYTISGFVNNDNESVINGLDKITYSFGYKKLDDIGTFDITPNVDALTAKNYKFKAASGVLTVNALDIQLSGVIECNYDANNPLVFSKDLFANAKFTAPSNSSIDLSKVYNSITEAKAKNYSTTNGVTVSPENGLFSYAFSKTQSGTKMAGSTYKIEGVTLDNKNFNLTTTEVYLKYKTAKIGDKYFTIEDAINSSATGDIILASNSSGTDTYVISAFTSLNYYGNKTFACSKNIIVPHTDGATTYENQKTGQTGNVGSVLIIPNGVSLTMDGSSLNILAIISQNNTTNTCTSAKRGVVMNQGTLIVKKQIKSGKNVVPNILAYGYLKGNGNVNVENGATVQDLFHLYDFKGGGITYGIHLKTKEYLPINSYSIHNVSCNVRVNAGCVYNTYYEITMGGEWFNGIIPVVSTADSAALFKLSSGYIEKRAIPAESTTWKNKKDSTGLTYGESLDKINGSNQLAGQKEDIRICGLAVDGSISITIKLEKWEISVAKVTMETGTNNPLPVPYMDIRVCNGGDLSLVNSSYKFMPGSSLTVDDGGKLTLGANAKLVLYSVEDCSVLEAPATYKEKDGTIKPYPHSFITRYCIDKVDAYFLINSNNVTLNGGVSGKIISEKSGVKLEIMKESTDITVLNVVINNKHKLLSFEYADVTTRNASSARPMKACGNIMNSSSTAEETHFETGTYYSTKIGSGYAWFKNFATITYNPKGGTLNENTTQNITLPSGGYTDLPTPTRDYYSFGGWYFDDALTQKATAIYTDCTLYAKWTPIQYKIVYNLPYDECGTLANGSLSGNQEKELVSPPNKTITVEGTTYVFLGWYLNSDYSGNSVASVSAANADNSGIFNVYAYYAGNSYTVTYEENPDNITFANNITVKKPEAQNFSQGDEIPLASLRSLSTYDSDEDFDYYFAGWYLSTDSTETIITSLLNTTDGDIKLCAKWIKKAQLKIELPVFENGNRTGNTIVYDTHKYFYKQTTKEIGINNLSSYIGSVYTVPESYKFIGFNASSGFTAKQNYSNMNNITTAIEVGATSDVLTITADIRKILTVTLEMDAESEKYWGNTAYFSIDNILIDANSIYSTDKSNWLFSDGTGNITPEKRKSKELQKVVFYILEGNTFTVTINNVTLGSISPHHYRCPTPITITNYTETNTNESRLFTFATVESDTTVKWTGKVKSQ